MQRAALELSTIVNIFNIDNSTDVAFQLANGTSGESNSTEGDGIKKAEQLSSALKSYYHY